MQEGIKNALDTYKQANNGRLPKQILIYRDACGGPSMIQKVHQTEIAQVIEGVNVYSGNSIKVLYCLIDQKISHRLFYNHNGTKINVGPGTVVDSELVVNDGRNDSSTFDFYMVPHSATVATAMPVLYSVKFNTTGFNKKDFETLTFHMCYLYFNFGGGIKVPNVCKYAEKAANYSVEIKGKPNVEMATKLHFL